jgi:hypothetical protein
MIVVGLPYAFEGSACVRSRSLLVPLLLVEHARGNVGRRRQLSECGVDLICQYRENFIARPAGERICELSRYRQQPLADEGRRWINSSKGTRRAVDDAEH